MPSLKKIGEEANSIEEELGITIDDVMNKLTQEFGELNDAIQKYRGRYCKKKAEDLGNVKEELGDLILNLVSICNKIGINPEEISFYASKTLEKFKERKKLYAKSMEGKDESI